MICRLLLPFFFSFVVVVVVFFLFGEFKKNALMNKGDILPLNEYTFTQQTQSPSKVNKSTLTQRVIHGKDTLFFITLLSVCIMRWIVNVNDLRPTKIMNHFLYTIFQMYKLNAASFWKLSHIFYGHGTSLLLAILFIFLSSLFWTLTPTACSLDIIHPFALSILFLFYSLFFAEFLNLYHCTTLKRLKLEFVDLGLVVCF